MAPGRWAAAMAVVGAVGMGTHGHAADAPRIDEIQWPGIDSYCTFMREGHVFDFNDPATWRFVFFTGLPEEGRDVMARAFMRIDGQLRELALVSVDTADDGEMRRFQTHDEDPYIVDLATTAGEEGYESTPHTGTITVSRGGMTSTIAFSGDCGV